MLPTLLRAALLASLVLACALPRPTHETGTDAERAVAEAKLADALSFDDARAWLKPKETMVVMGDRALLHVIAGLPEQAAS